MSVSHYLTRSCHDGTTLHTYQETVTSGAALTVDESIPDSSTNLQMAFAFTKAKLQSIFIQSDQAITLYTNDASTGSPQDTIALAANKPYLWSLSDAYFANPFGGNVTTLYVTNSSGSAATLKIRGIVDPT